jgi:hypothetical protein
VVVGGVRNANGKEGEEDAIRTGAGARIDLEMNGDAKYIGVSANGLSEQRTCLENDRKRAETQSGRLIGTKSNVESGEALRVRLAAQTATLNQVALSSAAALEKILKLAAAWVGADPEKVKVTPNMEFTNVPLDAQQLVNLLTARSLGAPISIESIHEVLVDHGLTTMEFEAEMVKILTENKQFHLPLPDAAVTVPAQPNQKVATPKDPKNKSTN